jgi:hypothetical protein
MDNIFDNPKTLGMDMSTTPDENILTWTTKDGKTIPISKMATSHIRNCIKMLKEKGFVSVNTVEFYLTCPEPMGDMAYDAYLEELDYVSEAPISPYIDYFEAELKKRGEKV